MLSERWYKTQYTIDDISKDLCEKWQSASNESLHFPERNDMIASDFSLRAVEGAPKDEPRLLKDDELCRLWYKPDNVFEMPKVNSFAHIRSSAAYSSPESSVLTNLWVQILQEHCNDFTYLASMANLHCSFVNARTGVIINVSGYNHKINVLMGRIVKAIIALPDKLEQDLFERIRDKTAKSYHNFLFSQPYQHAFYGGEQCFDPMVWSIDDKKIALAELTMSDLVDFHKRLLSRFHLEMLVHGNCSPDEATMLASTLVDGLKPSKLFASNRPQTRVVALKEKVSYVHRMPGFNEEDTNSCIANIYQMGAIDIRKNAVLALINHLIKEPAFNELRTEEQLGYIVHTSIQIFGNDIKNLLILIQSDSFDPIYLDGRVEAFLDRFRSKISKMTEEEWQTNIDAVTALLREKNKNLAEESTRYWQVISNGAYFFQKLKLVANEVETLKVTEVLRVFDRYFSKESSKRKKLSVQVFSKNVAEKINETIVVKESGIEDDTVLIMLEDVVDFKREMPLFPLPKKKDVKAMMMQNEEGSTQ
uniref:Peptidase M16 middle/third domain-containing protein n=1 Tax=Proboscia inermis TaxID=420281 RepID=A0A7S0CBY0_9STRA